MVLFLSSAEVVRAGGNSSFVQSVGLKVVEYSLKNTLVINAEKLSIDYHFLSTQQLETEKTRRRNIIFVAIR